MIFLTLVFSKRIKNVKVIIQELDAMQKEWPKTKRKFLEIKNMAI